MGKLDNRVAIVTGAAQGIGKAVADKLDDEGATVVGADLQDSVAIQVDISQEEDVRRMVADTVAEHGKLDVLVNVAAIVPFTPWDEIDFAEWRRVMSVNLDGTFLTNYYAQKAMRENGYGRIVNIASNVILAGTPNLAHYVASKGGVWAFTRALARELGPHGITVNSVAPGTDRDRGRTGEQACRGVRLRPDAPGDPAPRGRGRHRTGGCVPRLGGGRLGDRAADRRGRRPHPQLMARRAGAILAVSDVDRSVSFYRDQHRLRGRSAVRRPAVRHARARRCEAVAGGARAPGRGSARGRPRGAGRSVPRRRRTRRRGRRRTSRASAAGRRRRPLPGGAVRAAVGRLPVLLHRPGRVPGRDRAAGVRAVVLRAPGDVGVEEVADPADPRSRRRDRARSARPRSAAPISSPSTE